MVRDVRPMTLSFRGESITIDVPGWYCDASGESIHTGEDLKTQAKARATLKARALRLHTPDQVRAVRERLGLTQREAGAIIGGGPNAFQKYESGEVLVSKAGSNLLRLLEYHPEQVQELRCEPELA